MSEQLNKCCSKCSQVKPLDEFYRKAGCKDGKAGICKKCDLKRSNDWRKRNRERVNEIARNRNKTEPYRTKTRQRVKRWKKRHRELYLERKQTENLRRRAKAQGVSVEEYLVRQKSKSKKVDENN